MKTVHLETLLPVGSVVRGRLYDDPSMRYDSGDVFEVKLPNGLMLDVGWDGEDPDGPFRVVVYKDYFGDNLTEAGARDLCELKTVVSLLSEFLSHRNRVVFNSSSTTKKLNPLG